MTRKERPRGPGISARPADGPAADPAAIEKLVSGDRWATDGGISLDGPWRVRWRIPLLPRRDVLEHAWCFQIVATFAAGEERAPDATEDETLTRFERALRAAIEPGFGSVLMAVTTAGGERTFVVYSRDRASCHAGLDRLRGGDGAPAFEVEVFEDSGWRYLRDDILDGLVGND